MSPPQQSGDGAVYDAHEMVSGACPSSQPVSVKTSLASLLLLLKPTTEPLWLPGRDRTNTWHVTTDRAAALLQGQTPWCPETELRFLSASSAEQESAPGSCYRSG